MSNETIASGDCMQYIHNKPNQSNADNYELSLEQSLANNDLIIENIFKWLEPSQLIKCSEVCIKWKVFAQLMSYKRKYFSHKLLYFGSLSTQSLIAFNDKYLNIFRNSLEDVIDSYNQFIIENMFKEFKFILVFSKLNFNRMQDFIESQFIPNDCTVININCRNEIIGTQEESRKRLADNRLVESADTFDQLSGISALFMSRALPGIEVNVYKDSQIFDIKFDTNLKCILVFHIWRSLYGHFSRLKTDSEYVEYLENFVNNCDNNSIAFGGVSVERVVASETRSCGQFSQYLDYICCLTFSGPNVRAFSFVIDFNESNVENHLKTICNELKVSSNVRTETIGFVFDENAKQTTIKLKIFFKATVKWIGCSGISHGLNKINSKNILEKNQRIFFRRGKSVLIIIQIKKDFEIN